MKEELLARYTRLVTSVESEDYRRREGVELYKAKWILADGTNLRVSEVWMDGELTKYAYYWLDEQDALLRGWDNAPHHPRIESHPHHVHQGQEIVESEARSLQDVIEWLNQEIEIENDEM